MDTCTVTRAEQYTEHQPTNNVQAYTVATDHARQIAVLCSVWCGMPLASTEPPPRPRGVVLTVEPRSESEPRRTDAHAARGEKPLLPPVAAPPMGACAGSAALDARARAAAVFALRARWTRFCARFSTKVSRSLRAVFAVVARCSRCLMHDASAAPRSQKRVGVPDALVYRVPTIGMPPGAPSIAPAIDGVTAVHAPHAGGSAAGARNLASSARNLASSRARTRSLSEAPVSARCRSSSRRRAARVRASESSLPARLISPINSAPLRQQLLGRPDASSTAPPLSLDGPLAADTRSDGVEKAGGSAGATARSGRGECGRDGRNTGAA